MTLDNLILIAGFACLAYGFWRQAALKEAATLQARLACERSHVQLLDDTVSLKSIRLARSPSRLFAVKREYQFEFSSTGEHRYTGSVTLIGERLTASYLDVFKEPTINEPLDY